MNQSKKYLYLMVALIVSIFFTTLGQPWANAFAAISFLVSVIVSAYSISKSRFQLIIILVLGVSAIFPVWQLAVPGKIIGDTLQTAIWIIITFYIGLMIFRDIIKDKLIGSNEIYGAISVYLLIGICFGMIYQIVILFDPYAFYFNPTNFKNLPPGDGDIFYYSFITLSTVGYGDVSPVAPVARSISIIEAILGVMYIATMIARIIAHHTNRDKKT